VFSCVLMLCSLTYFEFSVQLFCDMCKNWPEKKKSVYLNNIPECYSTELNLVPASHSFKYASLPRLATLIPWKLIKICHSVRFQWVTTYKSRLSNTKRQNWNRLHCRALSIKNGLCCLYDVPSTHVKSNVQFSFPPSYPLPRDEMQLQLFWKMAMKAMNSIHLGRNFLKLL
jgi:hypothetical protein